MIVMYFYRTIGSEGVTYVTTVHSFYSMTLLEDGYCKVVFDGSQLRLSVETMRNDEFLECAAGPVHMRYAFQIEGRPVLQAQAMNLSTQANTTTAVLRGEATHTDATKNLQSYVRDLEEDRIRRFVDVHKMGIGEELMSSSFLSSNSSSIYIPYSSVGNMIINCQAMYHLLLRRKMNAPVATTIDITHPDDPSH